MSSSKTQFRVETREWYYGTHKHQYKVVVVPGLFEVEFEEHNYVVGLVFAVKFPDGTQDSLVEQEVYNALRGAGISRADSLGILAELCGDPFCFPESFKPT